MSVGQIPVKGIKLFIVTIAISLGTFLITLDQFIANVSIPTISGALGVSQDDGAWVITAFTTASAIMIPLVGWLTTIFGKIRYFSLSCILFALASFLCGFAPSFPLLLLFRVLQGLVSGALIPLSQTLLLLIYPPEKKGLAMGLWGLVIMIGPAMGPVLGGWITDNIGWPWIFYINVPVGIFAGLATYFVLAPYEDARKRVKVDIVGIILIVFGVGCLQILLDKGQDLDWFHSHIIRTLTVISLMSFSFLIPWELTHPSPVLPLDFFRSRNFTLGTICICLAMMILFGSFIIMPLWVQAQLGYTPYWAGLTLAPVGVLAIVLFPLIGIYQTIIDMRIWIGIAFLCFAGTFYWYSNMYAQVTYWDIAFPRLIQGAGFALFYVPLTTIAIAEVPNERLANATSLFSFTRTLFLSFGVSLSVTFWQRRAAFYQSRFVEFIIPSNPFYNSYIKALKQNLGVAGIKAQAFINQNVIQVESYTLSLLDLCYLGFWISLLILILLPFFRLPKRRKNMPVIAE